MEYASGGSLVTQVQQVQVFTEERAQFYTAEITLTLEFLHKHGILHRQEALVSFCAFVIEMTPVVFTFNSL